VKRGPGPPPGGVVEGRPKLAGRGQLAGVVKPAKNLTNRTKIKQKEKKNNC
jgi:hypothetical protein